MKRLSKMSLIVAILIVLCLKECNGQTCFNYYFVSPTNVNPSPPCTCIDGFIWSDNP